MKQEYKKMPDEDENAYIFRICENKESIGTWQDVCDILNKELNHEYNESWYRKMYQSFMTLFNVVKDKYCDKERSNYLEEKLLEIEKEKTKLRDIRTEINKSIRRDARVEDKLDILEEYLKKQGPIDYEVFNSNLNIDSDNDLLVMLSDIHFGQEFYSYIGCYNSDIAKNRLSQYLSNIIAIAKLHNSENCYLSLQGDLISGSIHKRLSLSNRENVIKQIMGVSELIASFIYELSKHFNKVYVYNVTGNHSRMDTKEDSLHDERLDSLISWYITAKLTNVVNNVEIKDDNIDSSIALITIRDNIYVAVHGDFDSYSSRGVSSLTSFIGFKPDAILFAHLHECGYGVENNILMIRNGCLCGSGDDYTIEKRLRGKASQMVCVCDKTGVKAFYPVNLS